MYDNFVFIAQNLIARKDYVIIVLTVGDAVEIRCMKQHIAKVCNPPFI